MLFRSLISLFPHLHQEATSVGATIVSVSNQTFLNFDHLAILIFTSALAATIGVLNESGALSNLLRPLLRSIKTAKQTKLTTYFLGLLIFFDDYTNALLIGNLMKKPFDQTGISRAKLAYIIDSTAAPVASLAVMSTWIGFEVNEIKQAIANSPIESELGMGPYGIFLNSIPYSFYPILTLIAVFFVVYKNINIGPMRNAKAEVLIDNWDKIPSAATTAKNSSTALISILFLLLSTFAFTIYTGYLNTNESHFSWGNLLEYIGVSSIVLSLLWSTTLTLTLTVLLGARSHKLGTQLKWVKETMLSVLQPLFVLYLAWFFAGLLQATVLAQYITDVIQSTAIDPNLFPAMIFIGAAFISFATGSSWGTMSILFPICVPALLTFSWNETILNEALFYSGIASILGGSVFGDHCSPLSDTTIISSIAAECPHILHVKTQLPYVLVVGSTALISAIIPVNYGLPLWVCLAISSLIMLLIFNILNRQNQFFSR